MADALTFKIDGLEEVLGKLVGFPKAMNAKGIRYAGRKAAQVIQKAAIANAMRIDDPETATSIAKNIAIRFSNRTFKQSGNILFRVGVLGGARAPDNAPTSKRATALQTKATKGNPGGDTYYWRFVEFGTENAAAKPFMRPALEQNIDAATNEFTSKLNSWVDTNLKKITKQGL